MIASPVKNSVLYVAEKPGIILTTDIKTGVSTTLLDLRTSVNEFGDRGLLDIAIHPDLVNNPYLYAFFEEIQRIPLGGPAQRRGMDLETATPRYSDIPSMLRQATPP